MLNRESIIFFDGNCNLCNGFVQFVLKNETEPTFLFCSLQSNFAIHFFKENNFNTIGIDSVIVFQNNQFYIQSKAAFIILKYLKMPFKLGSFFSFLPLFFTNFIYKIIAKYRYKVFGVNNTCWVMTNENKERFL
jgi:predicted DCC family thiol-disulfide oxidoreductase YuxK